MKRLICLMVLVAAAPAAHAEVFTRVFLADGVTPLEFANPDIPFVYRPIMTGTRLTIIVSSDLNGYWDGGALTIWDANQNYGVLSGALQLPAAGEMASAMELLGTQTVDGVEHDTNGFQFSGDPENAIAGDWFIVDYNAISIGSCPVIFFDWSVDWDHPLYQLSFTQVRTSDFDDSGIVNFGDFTVLTQNWLRTDCIEPEHCSGTDLDTDGDVDYDDLKLFADFWLERTR